MIGFRGLERPSRSCTSKQWPSEAKTLSSPERKRFFFSSSDSGLGTSISNDSSGARRSESLVTPTKQSGRTGSSTPSPTSVFLNMSSYNTSFSPILLPPNMRAVFDDPVNAIGFRFSEADFGEVNVATDITLPEFVAQNESIPVVDENEPSTSYKQIESVHGYDSSLLDSEMRAQQRYMQYESDHPMMSTPLFHTQFRHGFRGEGGQPGLSRNSPNEQFQPRNISPATDMYEFMYGDFGFRDWPPLSATDTIPPALADVSSSFNRMPCEGEEVHSYEQFRLHRKRVKPYSTLWYNILCGETPDQVYMTRSARVFLQRRRRKELRRRRRASAGADAGAGDGAGDGDGAGASL